MQQVSAPSPNDPASAAQGDRSVLDRFFRLSDSGTNVRTEVIAGVTTFLTMAYIIFVQPAVLSGKMFGFSGRRREIGWMTYLLAAVLIGYFIFVRGTLG